MARILHFEDLRPIDWHTGKRVPIPESEWATCDRCGARHVRVFHVEADDGRVVQVGETCAAKTDKPALRRAARDFEDRERSARADEVALALRDLQVPPYTVETTEVYDGRVRGVAVFEDGRRSPSFYVGGWTGRPLESLESNLHHVVVRYLQRETIRELAPTLKHSKIRDARRRLAAKTQQEAPRG